MKKTLSLIFTVLFLAVCLVPGLGLLLTGGADAAANEILPAAPVIAADGDFNPDFLAETAAYVNGRFSFRLEDITAWAKLNAALFRTSTAENVLLGRDGWLFYAPTIHDYTGDTPMTARELYCAARTLYLLQEYAENRGGDFLFTAAPNKNTLYPEYMPARTRLGSVSDMEAVLALYKRRIADRRRILHNRLVYGFQTALIRFCHFCRGYALALIGEGAAVCHLSDAYSVFCRIHTFRQFQNQAAVDRSR